MGDSKVSAKQRFLQDGKKAFASSVATPVLDHANLEQNKQSFRMSLAAGFKAGFEAASRL